MITPDSFSADSDSTDLALINATLRRLVYENPGASNVKISTLMAERGIEMGQSAIRIRLGELDLGTRYQRQLFADGEHPDTAAGESDIEKVQRQTQEEQLKRRIEEAKGEAEEWRKAAVDQQDFLDSLRAVVEARPAIKAPKPKPSTTHKDDVDLIAFISDVHVGQDFSIGDSGGLGEYNIASFMERAARYTDAILAFVKIYRRSFNVNRLIIIWGGDLVDGRTIHPGHEIQSEFIATQLDIGPQVMAQVVVQRLAAEIPHIDNFFTPGNHGREGRKGELHRVFDNFDTVFYNIVALHCRDLKHVVFHKAAQWYVDFRLRGHRYFASHGDNFKSWSGVPFYGATRNKGRMEGITNDMIDVIITGHHHAPANFHVNHGQVVMNGSWVGAGDFGTWLGMAGPPIQKLIVVHDDYPVMSVHDIYLVKPKDALTHKPIDLDSLAQATDRIGDVRGLAG